MTAVERAGSRSGATDAVTTLEMVEQAKGLGPWQRRGLALLGVVLFLIPFFTSDLQLRRLTQLIVLVLAVLGVNLLTGYTGLISLGHGVFLGVGAFTTATLVNAGVPLWAVIPLATCVAGFVGVALGLPALRVRGLYLALITFGYALAFPPVARRMGWWTGGVSGRSVDTDFAPPSFLGLESQTPIWRYVVCLGVVVFWFVLVRNLVTSRIGRALRAVRDGELAAEQFGINLVRTKTGVLWLSAAMTGTAGSLQAALFPFVSQTQFDTFLSLRLYAAAVLGGLGTISGAIYGVIALIVVPAINNAIQWLNNDAIVFGLGLIIMTFVAPNGVAGFSLRDRKRGTGSKISNWTFVEDERRRVDETLPKVEIVELDEIDWES